MRKRPLRFKKGLGMLLGITFMANTFVLGFSTWVYGQSSFINSGNINVGVGDVTTVNALSKDGENNVSTFTVCKDGIDKDDVLVTECGLIFKYKIQNNLISPNKTAIVYSSSLKMTNIQTSIEPFFKEMKVNEIVYPKVSPFPTVTSRSQTYVQEIDVPLNYSSQDGFTHFSICYTFTGNFYNNLLGNMGTTLHLEQVGIK